MITSLLSAIIVKQLVKSRTKRRILRQQKIPSDIPSDHSAGFFDFGFKKRQMSLKIFFAEIRDLTDPPLADPPGGFKPLRAGIRSTFMN